MTLNGFSSNFFDAVDNEGIAIVTFHAGVFTEEGNIEQLGQSLFQLVEHHGFDRILLDLSQVHFVTSSLLGKLITLHRKLHRIGGRLVLCSISEPVQSVMRRSNLLNYFHSTDSRNAGQKALADLE